MILSRQIIFFLCVLFASCANIGSPSGGPLDKKHPRVLRMFPENNSVFFSGNCIIITFDENIQYIKKENSISITPSLFEKPEIEAKGKKLYIYINDSLKKNTTYHIQLRDCVLDLNEGNAVPYIDISFSTGLNIDRGKIKGRVINAYTGKAASGYKVHMNQQMEDSSIFRSEPNYVTTTDNNGYFYFAGIKDESYRLYAFQDENDNNKPEVKEIFGFCGPVVYVDSNEKEILLKCTYDKSLDKPELRKYYCNKYGVFEFVTYPKGAYKRLVENNLFTDEAYLLEFPGIDEDTLIWYSPSAEMQDGHFDIYINDWWWRDVTMVHQMNNKIRRTCWITNNLKENGKLDLYDTLNIRFHNPIWNYDDRSVEVYEDSVKLNYQNNAFFRDNEKSQYVFPINFKPNKNYYIKFKPGSFTDIFNQRVDSFSIRFKTEDENLYGNLSINIKQAKAKPLLIELLDDHLKPIRSNLINGSNTIEYKYLPPGNYKVRVVDDINMNNKFDEGYINRGLSPENAYLFDDIIPIKAKIDLENIIIDLDKAIF